MRNREPSTQMIYKKNQLWIRGFATACGLIMQGVERCSYAKCDAAPSMSWRPKVGLSGGKVQVLAVELFSLNGLDFVLRITIYKFL